MNAKLFYKLFFAFLFVALLPALIGSYLFTKTLETYLHDHLQVDAEIRLDKTAIQISGEVGHIDDVLGQLAKRIYFTERDDKVIAWLYNSHPQLVKIVIVDMGGVVHQAIARYSHIAKGTKLARCEPEVISEKRVRLSRWKNEPMLTIHYPIISLSTGEQKGVLHAEISVASLFHDLSMDTEKHLQYLVNQYNGQVVFHPDFNLVLNSTDVSVLPVVEEVLAGADFASGEYENMDEEKVVAVAKVIKNTPFLIVEETKYADAYHLLQKRKEVQYLIGWFSVIFICITAFLFSQSITRPIRNLLLVIAKIEKGNLDTPIPQTQAWVTDEISMFSDSFRQMVASLKDDRKQRDDALLKEKEIEEKLRKVQKMEAIGLLAGGVAHDLNNILSGIVSYPELLLLKIPEDSELREPLEVIQQSGLRASEVVADLLTVARGVAATRVVRNVNDLIHEYLASPEYERLLVLFSEVICRLELAKELHNISCSPVHIKKCIMNLMHNAMEAVGEYGTIRVATRNQFVEKAFTTHPNMSPGNYIVISVADDGGGISKKDLDCIFEPFYSSKIMGRSGTGLGLTVVWNSVKDHDGVIVVESDSKGTVFEMYFPVTEKNEIPAADNSNSILLTGNGETILIVDDVQEQRDIAGQILIQLGFVVHLVSSGEEAIDYLGNNSADLLLLDMIMDPGINGYETYKQILQIHPGQKAVIASGFSKSDAVKATLKLGAGGFIKKPYSINHLGQIVTQVLKA